MQVDTTQTVAVVAEQGWRVISLEGWLTIIAIVLGPILALWAQRERATVGGNAGRENSTSSAS